MKAKTLAGLAAAMITVALLVAGNWLASGAEPVASISLPPPGATKQLFPGCNNIGLTFADGTSSVTVTEAVQPPGSVEAMWRHDAAGQRWQAFSPTIPAASDLASVNFLDAVWLCLPARAPGDQASTPEPNGSPPTGSTSPFPTPAPGSPGGGGGGEPSSGTVSAVVAPTSALTSFRYSMQTSIEIEGEAFNITITSSGTFRAPDSMFCVLTGSVAGLTFDIGELVVIRNSAWLDEGFGWTPLAPDDRRVVENLKLCPGSAVFWQSLWLPADLGGIRGQLTTVNGVPAVRVSIVGLTQGLPDAGLIPLTSDGATVHAYDIWVAQSGSWVAALAFDAVISGDAGDARALLREDLTTPNDPNISVQPPM